MHELASKALFAEQTNHLDERLLVLRGWTVVTASYPVLDVRFDRDGRVPLRVQISCEGWNDSPPRVVLLNAEGHLLGVGQAPAGSSIFNQGPHAATQLPFICMAGSREYHTHSSHVGDVWDNYRPLPGYDLGGIVGQIWNGWLKCTP